MKGKGVNSNYLLTRILATDYFHAYSTPAFFAAYFFPFVAHGENRPYYESEFEKKLLNVRENRHGNFYNYATQGFGSVAFYKPDIDFYYFYQKVSAYEDIKKLYFQSQEMFTLESPEMKEDLQWVFSAEKLLLKRGISVSDMIKTELLDDLSKHDNKYVLAKTLYYIVHEHHVLPNVSMETQKIIADRLEFSFEYVPNVCMDFRKTMDEEFDSINNRVQYATEIQLLAFDGVSLFGENDIARDFRGVFGENLEKIISRNTDLRMEIILSESKTEFHDNMCHYQTNMPHLRIPKKELVQHTLDKLLGLKKRIKKGMFDIKTTTISIPYSLFIICFEDEDLDYCKVDLYSPFISENKDRPSMYILKRTNPDLFDHFKNVFENMWKSDEYSHFLNG